MKVVAHAQRAGTQGHHLGKPVLRSAQQFAQCGRGVIGGLGDEAEDRLLHRQPRAGQEAKLGGFHRGGLRRYRHELLGGDASVTQGFEHHVQCHQLGEARRVAWRVGVCRFKDVAGAGVDHDGTVAVRADLSSSLPRKGGGKGDSGTHQSGQTHYELASRALRSGHSLLTSGGPRGL